MVQYWDMKREIKFRYWNSFTNQMVNDPNMPFLQGWKIQQLFSERGRVWMQYTGIKDKNGKEIYEGDICDFTYNDKNYRYPVIWDDGWFLGYVDLVNASCCMTSLEAANYNDIEIIGNIYENPELISKGQLSAITY